MKLYKPVLIETAEQAEALPVGTVALNDDWMARKVQDGGWAMIWPPSAHATMRSAIGWTALVPIETEEETTGALVNRAGEIRWEESTRYVTEWTEEDA